MNSISIIPRARAILALLLMATVVTVQAESLVSVSTDQIVPLPAADSVSHVFVVDSRPVALGANSTWLLGESEENWERITFFLERVTQERIAGFGRERFGRPLFRPLLLGPTPAGEHAAPPLAP